MTRTSTIQTITLLAIPAILSLAAQTAILPPALPWHGLSEALVVPPGHPWITPAEAADFDKTSDTYRLRQPK